LPAVGFLTTNLPEANREEARKSQAAAENCRSQSRTGRSRSPGAAADRLVALGQLTAGSRMSYAILWHAENIAEMLERQVRLE
jgi:hypothetical protein